MREPPEQVVTNSIKLNTSKQRVSEFLKYIVSIYNNSRLTLSTREFSERQEHSYEFRKLTSSPYKLSGLCTSVPGLAVTYT